MDLVNEIADSESVNQRQSVKMNSGFSLIELVIGLFLFAFCVMGVMRVYTLSQTQKRKENVIYQAEQYAFYRLEAYPDDLPVLFLDHFNVDRQSVKMTKVSEGADCQKVTVTIQLNEGLKTVKQSRLFCFGSALR